VSPEHGAGVFSVWQTITDGIDPLELKRRTWDSGNPYREFLNLHLNVVETDREYPFLQFGHVLTISMFFAKTMQPISAEFSRATTRMKNLDILVNTLTKRINQQTEV
jgi:hypothetical protein